jgi:hypothetical protein
VGLLLLFAVDGIPVTIGFDAYINEITGDGFRAMARTILDEV